MFKDLKEEFTDEVVYWTKKLKKLSTIEVQE